MATTHRTATRGHGRASSRTAPVKSSAGSTSRQAPRRGAPRKSSGRVVPGRLVILVLFWAAALVAGLWYGTAVQSSSDVVREGVTVLGVPIGGLRPGQAIATLNQRIGANADSPLTVTAGDKEFTLDPAKAGLSFDAAATVESAMGTAWNPMELLGLTTPSLRIDPVIRIDHDRLAAALDDIATVVATDPVEPTLAYVDGVPDLTPGEAGLALDVAGADEVISTGWLSMKEPIELPMTSTEPSVPADVAEGIADGLALAAVSAPVTVDIDGTPAVLGPGDIANALTFDAKGGTLVPALNGEVLHDALATELAALETPGRDASFAIENGVPVVVPAVDGQEVDVNKLAESVLGVLDRQPDYRIVKATVEFSPARVTTEEAQALGITEKLSSFTQNFPFAPYRVQNIGQAAEYVNGTILKPGATFSMNDTIKERTAAHGYTKGFVVGPGGIFREAMGGGVSTATTAVWTAAFYAGMERVYTQAHSIFIDRYQPGLEATVSWGEFDMRFRNNTDNGILITTQMTDESMTVTFWGTKVYDEVRAEFGKQMNVVEPETIYDTSKSCLGQGGAPGFTIDVTRVFVLNGEVAKREVITTSYSPSPKVICGAEPDKQQPSGEEPVGDPSGDTVTDPGADLTDGGSGDPGAGGGSTPGDTSEITGGDA